MSLKTTLCGMVAAVFAVLSMLGDASQPAAQERQNVTYLLPAPTFLPAFGPWMVAQAQGYYEEEGFEVEFQTARGGVDVATQVGAGNAVIGGGIGDTPILVRANGIPVRAVAVLGGRALTQLVVAEDSDIRGPADLRGRTVTVMSYQDTTFYALLGALSTADLTRNDLNIQAAGPSGVWQLFTAGESDAMAAVPDWIALSRAEGKNVRIMPVENYFPSMAQAILASDSVIEEQPDLIRSLVRATLKGMRDIMEDPAAAAAVYVQAVERHQGNEAGIEAVFRLYNEYVYAGQETLGLIDPERLRQVQEFYVEQGIVRRATPVEDLYTNQFVTE